ncbi:hypothetical protein B2A_06521, partial [mine drainage metagenome]
KSFWLGKEGKRPVALKPVVHREGPATFEVVYPRTPEEVHRGTVHLAKATCLVCNSTLPADRVRTQLRDQGGGADPVLDAQAKRISGATLLAVVTSRTGTKGRKYREPTRRDWEAVSAAHAEHIKLLGRGKPGNTVFPDQPISTPLGREFRIGDPYYNFTPVLNYGITRWSQLFTKRQLVGLAEMSGLILSSASQRPPLARLLAMSFDRVLMSDMSLTRWNPSGEKMQHTFGR